MKKYNFIVSGYVVANQFLQVKSLPKPGITAWVTNDDYDRIYYGGPGFNISYGLARLGARVLPMLSYVSDDKRTEIETLLTRVGAATEALEAPRSGSSGVAVMIQDENKNHMTIACRNSCGMEPPPLREMSDRYFTDSECAVLTISLPQNVPLFLNKVRQHNVPLAFSMRADEKIFPREILWEALTAARLIFMNDAEQQYLNRIFGSDGIDRLFDCGAAQVIVTTLGKDGSVIHQKEDEVVQTFTVPATVPENIVDTTGAGDAFVSGFLYGYIRGKSLRLCAQYGSTAASFIIERTGSIENTPELDAVLKRNLSRPDAVKE